MGEGLVMKALKPEAGLPESMEKLDTVAHTSVSLEAHGQASLMCT